jgi:hypothetical protein
MKSKPHVFIVESLRFTDENDDLFEGKLISRILALSGSPSRYVYLRVLVQSEMEKKFFPLVKIPPLRGGDFQGRRIHRPMPVSHGFASVR